MVHAVRQGLDRAALTIGGDLVEVPVAASPPPLGLGLSSSILMDGGAATTVGRMAALDRAPIPFTWASVSCWY